MALSKQLTKVTPLSKTLALVMFILLPIIAFMYGTQYQQAVDTYRSFIAEDLAHTKIRELQEALRNCNVLK